VTSLIIIRRSSSSRSRYGWSVRCNDSPDISGGATILQQV